MAESIVQVTEGAGKKLHTFQRTIGANSVEDEVVLNGEPYLATYGINTSAGLVSTATVDSHLIQVMAGASLNVYLRRIDVYQAAMATAVGNPLILLRRLSTAGTGGTVLTVEKFDTTDSAAGATAMTLPTVKGTETLTLWAGNAWFMQTLAASSVLTEPCWSVNFDTALRSKGIRIPAGTANGVALRIMAATAGATVSINVVVSEANF